MVRRGMRAAVTGMAALAGVPLLISGLMHRSVERLGVCLGLTLGVAALWVCARPMHTVAEADLRV